MPQLLRVEYFRFEEDFMDDNIRCIPMIVRFKLDACGIKLKLKEWSKMTVQEREQLAERPVDSSTNKNEYHDFVRKLIYRHTGEDATPLTVDVNPAWSLTEQLPQALQQKLRETGLQLSLNQWCGLSTLQRFALVKLSRPGHENKNFPRAMKEFGLY